MTTLNFNSSLAAQIENFIDLRRISGTDYNSQSQLLSYFDRFLAEQGLPEPIITRQMIDGYQESLSHLAPRSQGSRFSVVRQFCEHLAQHDPRNYVPESRRTILSHTARQPYIFSHDQILSLLAAASKLKPAGSLRPHTYRTLLGLLYTTGIRVGEALGLNLEDFHESEQGLYVAAGKFRKQRWIILSDSTCREVEAYLKRRRRVKPRSPDSPLFLSLRFRRLHQATLYQTFRFLLQDCRIPHNKQTGPRIHDLRHTFAVHRLLDWYRDGRDAGAQLPALATYMGHVDINSTRVYLRPTAELLVEVGLRFRDYYLQNVNHKGEKT